MTDPVVSIAGADRWQPTRAGLTGIWRYWDETFTFHRGRLLLRGPNGSGKSMALELLLPFLLDGDSSPSRLTSAARPRGRLFERVMTGTDDSSRTGFTWVEFRRHDEVFTVGARLRASRGTGKVDVDLFTTTQAVGHDLHLLDGTRTPLSRAALNEAIGEHGGVHASADEHRGAVRATLFPGFGAQRYASVIGALLALRKEKLSQNLDLAKLSDVLSDALPPLDDADIAAVAEGFERLDRRRAELTALDRDVGEVRLLDRAQRAYAHAVVTGVADAVRASETTRDDVTRSERAARDDLAATTDRADAAAGTRAELESRDDDIVIEVDALKDTDAYRAGAALADLRDQARRLTIFARRATESAAARAAEHQRASARERDAAGQREVAASNLTDSVRELHASAESVGARAIATDAEQTADADDAERLLAAWVQAQRGRVREIRSALERHSAIVLHRDHRAEQVTVTRCSSMSAWRSRSRRMRPRGSPGPSTGPPSRRGCRHPTHWVRPGSPVPCPRRRKIRAR